MKKTSVKGRNLKNVSDPKLAKSHKQGAVVELVQPALNPKWGRYYFKHYHRSYIFLEDSIKYFDESIILLEQINKLKVDEKTGTRFVKDELRNKLEASSAKFLILSKLGLEYLTVEMLPIIKRIKDHRSEIFERPDDDTELLIRLKAVLMAQDIDKEIPQQVKDILTRRDILEHPNQDRLYNCVEGKWKNNHLSWVLSGEMEGLLEPCVDLVNEITSKFEKYVADNPIPGNLEGLKRGIKAGEPFKK